MYVFQYPWVFRCTRTPGGRGRALKWGMDENVGVRAPQIKCVKSGWETRGRQRKIETRAVE